MNPFITRWDKTFARKERRVFNICLHRLNSNSAIERADLRYLLFVLSTTDLIPRRFDRSTRKYF